MTRRRRAAALARRLRARLVVPTVRGPHVRLVHWNVYRSRAVVLRTLTITRPDVMNVNEAFGMTGWLGGRVVRGLGYRLIYHPDGYQRLAGGASVAEDTVILLRSRYRVVASGARRASSRRTGTGRDGASHERVIHWVVWDHPGVGRVGDLCTHLTPQGLHGAWGDGANETVHAARWLAATYDCPVMGSLDANAEVGRVTLDDSLRSLGMTVVPHSIDWAFYTRATLKAVRMKVLDQKASALRPGRRTNHDGLALVLAPR